PLANKPINWLRNNAAGNPDVAEYLAQVEIVKNEATRVISNPRLVCQMTDTARQEMESIINGNMSVAATNQVLDRLKNDGQRRLTTMQDQNDNLTGNIKGMMTKDTGDSGGSKSSDTPATNKDGWKLHVDKNGAKAYVSPDGKNYQTVN